MKTIFSLICLCFIIPAYSQIEEVIDTSDYLPGETDINLLIAADKGYPSEVVRLLDKGANVDFATYEGVTALMYAAQRGHEKVVQILLEKGADPDKKPNDGNTALHGAAMFNNLDVVEILLKNNANIDVRNKKGITPLIIATGYNYFILTDMLLFYGADPDIKDEKGNDALLTATYKENFEIIDLLLENGANVNTSDEKGFTPLMIATQYNNTVLTELFIDYGANVNLKNSLGFDALTYAIMNDNTQMVKKMIELGADINTHLDYATTPLTLAKQNANDSIKKILLSYGAKRNPYPDFSDVNIGPLAIFNLNDFRAGLSFQLSEIKYKVNLVGSYEIRPTRKRIWRESQDDIIYQFWETRHVVTAGLQKTFIISKSNPDKFHGFHISAKAGHTFGSYRGYLQNAKTKTFFMPEAGLSVIHPKTLFKISYAYMPFDTENINPHQIKITYQFTFFLNKKRYKNKEINWLNQ